MQVPYNIQDPNAGVAPQSGIPDDYLHVSVNPDQFGAQIGQAQEKLGGAMESAATTVNDIIVQRKQKENEAVVNAAQDQWMMQNNNLLHAAPQVDDQGNTVPGTGGFYAQQGDAARNAQAPTLQAMQANRQAAMDALENPHQKLMFDQLTRRQFDWNIEAMSRHADQQGNAADDAKTNGLVATTSQSAILAGLSGDIGKDSTFAEHLADGENVERSWARRRGLGDDVGESKAQTFTGGTVLAMAKHLSANGQIDTANSLLDTYKDRMDKGSVVAVETLLKSANEDRTADTWAHGVVYGSPAAPKPGSTPPATGAPGDDTSNNLGNIRANATSYKGFTTPEDGAAATASLLRNSYRSQGNIAAIGEKWAPRSENDTDAWIKNVSTAAGMDPKAPINFDDPAQLAKVVSGIATAEQSATNRAKFTPDVITSGVNAAISGQAPASVSGANSSDPKAAKAGILFDKSLVLAKAQADFPDNLDLQRRAVAAATREYAAQQTAAASEILAQKSAEEKMASGFHAEVVKATLPGGSLAPDYFNRVANSGMSASAIDGAFNFAKENVKTTADATAKTYGPGFTDAIDAIRKPVGDPGRISNSADLFAYYGQNPDKLTPSGVQEVSKFLKMAHEQPGDAEAITAFLKGAKSHISGSDTGYADPAGDMQYA
jgi:hypothetical protein